MSCPVTLKPAKIVGQSVVLKSCAPSAPPVPVVQIVLLRAHASKVPASTAKINVVAFVPPGAMPEKSVPPILIAKMEFSAMKMFAPAVTMA
jgi:hypothetical protein